MLNHNVDKKFHPPNILNALNQPKHEFPQESGMFDIKTEVVSPAASKEEEDEEDEVIFFLQI